MKNEDNMFFLYFGNHRTSVSVARRARTSVITRAVVDAINVDPSCPARAWINKNGSVEYHSGFKAGSITSSKE